MKTVRWEAITYLSSSLKPNSVTLLCAHLGSYTSFKVPFNQPQCTIYLALPFMSPPLSPTSYSLFPEHSWVLPSGPPYPPFTTAIHPFPLSSDSPFKLCPTLGCCTLCSFSLEYFSSSQFACLPPSHPSQHHAETTHPLYPLHFHHPYHFPLSETSHEFILLPIYYLKSYKYVYRHMYRYCGQTQPYM